MRQRPKSGFTLVELLVVIAIIGILVALLLPAVQSAREAARRLQCQNNLKQLGLACLTYAQGHEYLPPASHWSAESDIDKQNNDRLSETWAVIVLPFVEQQNLYDSFDLSLYMTDPLNEPARSTQLAIMLCPSDTYNRENYSGRPSSDQNSNHGPNWARGNYAANGGLGFQSDSAHCTSYGVTDVGCSAFDSPGWNDPRIRGVMGANISVKPDDIKDGTSNTIMLVEIRAGVTSFDPRGVWALPGASTSSIWAHGYLGDSYGPNGPAIHSDDSTACAEVADEVGGSEVLQEMGMGCYPGTSSAPNRQGTARSMHLGGIFCCFADGSVHWINDFIEVSNTVNHASTWDRLMLSKDKHPISADAW